MPGPKVSAGAGDDERLLISIPATMFKVLAAEGELADWQEALHYGHLQVDGDPRVKRLLGQAIEPALAASRSGRRRLPRRVCARASQLLHRPTAIRHPVDVAREAGPIQAQEPRAARLAFRARSRGLTAADVDRARTEERSLLRAWMMRKTVHLIPTEDAGWLLPLFAGADRALVAKAARRLRARSLRPGPGARGAASGSRRARTADQARARRAASQAGSTPPTSSRSTSGCWRRSTASSASGPTAAADVSGSDRRLARRARAPAARRVTGRVARRYLRAYGPATERDFARWAGLPLRDGRLGLERIAAELQRSQSRRGHVVRLSECRGRRLAGRAAARGRSTTTTSAMPAGRSPSTRPTSSRIVPGGGIV